MVVSIVSSRSRMLPKKLVDGKISILARRDFNVGLVIEPEKT